MLDADPRAYLAQYAMDENSPGMEDDPLTMAQPDIMKLEKGGKGMPFANVNRDHIKEHQKYLASPRFTKLKKEHQQMMIDHVRQELEPMKQQVKQIR